MNVNLIAPLGYTGYGMAGVNVLKALTRLGHNVSLFPIGQANPDNQEDAEAIKRGLHNAQTFDPHATCIRIWHQFDMAQRVGSGRFVGFPIFELDTLKPNELHHLSTLDEIAVTSQWAKQVLLNNGIHKPIKVCPLGVDRTIFQPQPQSEATKGLRTKPGNMVILNMGKWEVRKGHDILAKIFMDTFSQLDAVELWMCPFNPFLNQHEVDKFLRNYGSRPGQIKVLDRLKSHKNVAEVMNAADIGVFPSRAEGWNMEALEMLSCSKHIIITECSAHTEYCTHENSHLVMVPEVEPAKDEKWFYGEGNWAKLDEAAIEQISGYMRELYDRFHFTGLSRNLEGIKTAQQYSWENTAQALLAETEEGDSLTNCETVALNR